MVVRGLQPYQIVQLWQQVGLPLTAEHANELQVYSGGNPRLLLLCLNIYREQASQALSFNDLLATLPAAAGFQPLFQRIWDYATAAERALLMRLSVFRGFAPDHLWDATLLQSLSERHLIERNALGGVAIAHTFAEIIYAQLSAEARLRFHQQAARNPISTLLNTPKLPGTVGKPNNPIWQYNCGTCNRHNEILRGHAAQALTIFDSISHERVGKQEAQSLVLPRRIARKMWSASQSTCRSQQRGLGKDERTERARQPSAAAILKTPSAIPKPRCNPMNRAAKAGSIS